MINKLFSKKTDKTHPLLSEAGIQMLLDGMPRDDVGFLVAIDGWLENIPQLAGEHGIEPCLRAAHSLDKASRPTVATLLHDYLDSEGDKHLSLAVHDSLSKHIDSLCGVYGLITDGKKYPRAGANHAGGVKTLGKDHLKLIGTEFFTLWGLSRRLAHFRYLKQDVDSWHLAHSMLDCLRSAGALPKDAGLFGAEEIPERGISPERVPRTGEAFREYLNVLYLSLSPVTNLSPIQLEFAYRLISDAEALSCADSRDAETTYYIDLAGAHGPKPLRDDDALPPEGSIRYFSLGKLRKEVKIYQAAIEARKPLPKRFANLPINRSQILKTLFLLSSYWEQPIPSRTTERIMSYEVMRGTVGFEPALRMVEIADKARNDKPVTDPQIELLNRLWRLEEQVDRQKIEDWIQVDGNDLGIGVTIPMLLPHHVAGSLVAVRYAEEPGWHLGIVRRIGNGTDENPKLGLQTFPGHPMSVEFLVETSTTDEPPHYFKAIAFDAIDDQLLIPTGIYAQDKTIKLMFGMAGYTVKLSRLLESGPDYELVEYVLAK